MNRLLYALLLASLAGSAQGAPLGLPEVPVPADNPQTADKIKLGDKLFHDTRFSTTGEVSCSTCHAREKGFTDQLRVSEGINKLTGTRNAPTVINAAYMQTQFWDGREPDLDKASVTSPLIILQRPSRHSNGLSLPVILPSTATSMEVKQRP